jgi:uncharacterized protein (DUF1800 family)
MFDEPAAPDALVEPVALGLRQGEFEIGPAVKRILSSNLFFSEYAVGRKVRSPVELGLGLFRPLEATGNMVMLAGALGGLGQSLFQPPNVKGWDGGRAWINSSSLLGRANLARQLLLGSETRFGRGGLEALATGAGANSPEQTVDWLLELLVAAPVPTAARDGVVQLLAANDGPPDRSRRITEAAHVIATFPEFQLA